MCVCFYFVQSKVNNEASIDAGRNIGSIARSLFGADRNAIVVVSNVIGIYY